MAWVYILQSQKDNKYYIGSTINISRRLVEHNSGKNKSTKYRFPFKLIYKEEFESLKQARSREYKIKSYKNGQAFKKLLMNAGVVHR